MLRGADPADSSQDLGSHLLELALQIEQGNGVGRTGGARIRI